jgi:hypothetical protein
MDMNDHIKKLVDDTLNSMDHHTKAAPAPYLLSRINARLLQLNRATRWDRLTSVITRPTVAIAGLFLVIMLNVLIISTKKASFKYNATQENQVNDAGFSIASSALYDIENIEP